MGYAVSLLAAWFSLAACSSTDDDPTGAPAAQPAEPTPLADYDTDSITLARAPFCDRFSRQATSRALGSTADGDGEASPAAWQPGQRVPETTSVGNEYGCSWSFGDVSARAWVFAPPVTSGQAEAYSQEVLGPGCQRLNKADELGNPSIAQRCTDGQDAATDASEQPTVKDPTNTTTGFHGLVGDAWVGCEIDGTRNVRRVSQWCVEVLAALAEAPAANSTTSGATGS